MDFLKTLKVPSPVFPNDANKLITLDSDASITEGFKTLISNNILSVPLYDEKTKSYTTSLSLVDIVLHALDALSSTEDKESDISSALTNESDKLEFQRSKARDVAGKAKQTLPVVTDKSVAIDKVVDIMVKTKAHHVLALNEQGDLVNVITQTRIIECVNMLFGIDPQLTELGAKTVVQLGLGLRKVISIHENAKTVDAFRALAENNVSGIPIIQNDGVVVGNISVRDLRAIKHNASFLQLLHLPLSEYLEASHKQFAVPQSLVKCYLEDSFRSVMDRIVENKVHRCYVVDKNDKLLGVVTMWDLLNTMQHYYSPPPVKVSLPSI